MPPYRRTLLIFLILVGAASPVAARDIQGFGSVSFVPSCAPSVQASFETALARLHAFDGPEDAFQAVARDDPHCAIAWWGAAMAVRGNPLAGVPDLASLKAGQAYMVRAREAGATSPREAGLITALGTYYRDPAEDHAARTQAYEAAMRVLAAHYPGDPEVQSLFALAILEAVDLTDKTYARQIEAGRILELVWAEHPKHPGAPHYLIHAYDYPPLAAKALNAARAYAGIAPASAHAQHMPSHIYSMLGLWRDSIAANRASAALVEPGAHHAMAMMDAADPHGMDFITYAHLQLGEDRAAADALARATASEERTIAAARYLIERGDWAGAARMPLPGGSALNAVTVRFVRALGAARTGKPEPARGEIAALRALRAAVLAREGAYWAGLVDVYVAAADAWTRYAAGDAEGGIRSMAEAAAMDDAREKHILLENKLVPVRELQGELLLAADRPERALAAFDASLATAPNRFRSELGAARAARALGRADEARRRYEQAASQVATASPGRPDITEARSGASGRPATR